MNILLMLAVLPAAVLLVYIYKIDTIEKEPGGLLAKLLGFGALSTIPAIVLEIAGETLFLDAWQGCVLGYLVLENFIVVALVEEACKFFFLYWRTWKHPAFNYTFDGIVYAVFTGLGFAILENIMYVFEYGFATGVVRAFTAIPGHAVFAVFMGYYYGQAKLCQAQNNKSGATRNLVCALVVAILCHGLYDLLASADSNLALLCFFIFLLGMVYAGYRLSRKAAREATPIGPSSHTIS